LKETQTPAERHLGPQYNIHMHYMKIGNKHKYKSCNCDIHFGVPWH